MLHGVEPLGYSFWQSLGPAIFLSVVLILRKTALPLSSAHIRYYILSGLFGIALPNTIMYFSAAHLPAGILAVLVNTVPLITYPLALLFAQEKFSIWRLLAVLIGVTGIMILVLPGAEFNPQHFFPWGLIVLLTPLSFAFVSIYIAAFRPPQGDSLAFSAGMLITSAIALMPLMLLTHSFQPLWLPMNTTQWLILLEILLSSIGYILFFMLIKRAGPVYYSLVGCVVSLTGLFWGWLLFDEQFDLQSSVAIFCILAAIILITLKPRQN
jgi:drug/metabolite transporter (DMT)-like permease